MAEAYNKKGCDDEYDMKEECPRANGEKAAPRMYGSKGLAGGGIGGGLQPVEGERAPSRMATGGG
ncbi:unnamed protein product, partial [Closterium sp. NIES-64]